MRLVGSGNLAPYAERHMRGEPVDDAAILDEIAPAFIEEDGRRTDIVVLACTHYPFLLPHFERLAPWPVDVDRSGAGDRAAGGRGDWRGGAARAAAAALPFSRRVRPGLPALIAISFARSARA